MNTSILRSPAAWIPVLMSLAALALVISHIAIYGFVHETDEGTPAHIFQLLMAGQLPLVAFFAINWLPREPRWASVVLVLQAVAGVAALASVYILEHSS